MQAAQARRNLPNCAKSRSATWPAIRARPNSGSSIRPKPRLKASSNCSAIMYSNSNADKLMEVVRNEKDPKVRAEAVRVLASQKSRSGR